MAARPARHRPGLGPDLLVHENAELAAPLVGAVLGVPSVTHSFGTAVPVAILDDTAARLARCGASTASTCRRTPAASGPATSTSVRRRCRPCRSTTSRTSSRSGRCPTRLRRRRRTGNPLVYVTLGTVQNRPELLRDVVAGVAALPVQVLVAVGPRTEPASLGQQPDARAGRVVGRPGGGAGAAARPWSRTAAPAPSWARWRAGCPSSACRRPPTSSATPRAGAGPAPR